jgi:hypothetical protein
MEMLRNSYLKHGGREFVLPPKQFETKQKDLVKDIKALLKEHFPADESWTDEERKKHREKLSNMATHIKGANRYGFKHSLIEMASELNLFAQQVYENLAEKQDARGFLVPTHLDPTEQEETKAKDNDMLTAKLDSIRTFVQIRDHITHQGLFMVPDVNEAEGWDQSRINEERHRQLRFLERFVGAFLATILGWHQPLPKALNLPRSR